MIRVKRYFRILLVNNNMYKFMIKPCERAVVCRALFDPVDVVFVSVSCFVL